MQRCQLCKRHPATLQTFVPAVGGIVPICSSCLVKTSTFGMGGGMTTVSSYTNINGIEEFSQYTVPSIFNRQVVPVSHVVCPNCGYDLNDFKRTSRLGCSNCYNVFGKQLAPLIQQIHGVSL